MRHLLAISIFLTLLALVASSYEAQNNRWNKQMQQSQAIRGNQTFTEQYAFYMREQSVFSVTPQVDERVSGNVRIFWNVNGLFLPAQYNPGQEVRLIVKSHDGKTIVDVVFYILAGYSFDALKGEQYTITIQTQGRIEKMAIMKYDIKGVKVEGLKSGEVSLSTTRLKEISDQIRNIIRNGQTNRLIQDKIVQKALANTKSYMGYNFLQGILLFVLTFVQVTFIRKLLARSSSVI